MNKYTTFEWVKKVISSVENNSQDIVSEQLIMNFDVMLIYVKAELNSIDYSLQYWGVMGRSVSVLTCCKKEEFLNLDY